MCKGDFDDSAINNETKRDPYFAFIPQIARYGANVIGGELNTVKNGIVGFPSWSKQFATDTVDFYKKNPRTLFDEVISGFTVAIMQVPESIAFSFVAGVPPQSGLHATFWMATITGILGGKPGMISGAAGALAVVVTELTADDGVLSYLSRADRLNVLYMTMFICGIMQMLFCVFRLAKLVRLIPETGMIAFMDGLAIIIFMAQLPAFQKCDAQELFIECEVSQRQWLTFQDDTWQLIFTLIHVGMCMFVMKFFGKIPLIGKIVPSSLIALLLGTLIEFTLFRRVFGVGTRTVGETATMNGDVPRFDWPTVPTDSNTMSTIFSYAITLATIGSVESVLTLQACNEITDTIPKVSDSNQELFAQGLANAVCGLFRAMGGDAMIGQSTINIMNGARHRVSSTCSGLFMLLFVIAISGFIEMLPIATLTGVLFMVVLSTFQWQTFHILRYGRLSDSLVIVLVTVIAVFVNLAVAIGAGVIFSALVHAWDSGACVSADIFLKRMTVLKDGEKEECDVKYVHVKGSIFFGSARHFIELFSVANDPDVVIIDFKDALIIDHSAVAAIQGITHRFHQAGKEVLLTNLAKKSTGRIYRTGDHDVLNAQIQPFTHFEDVFEGDAKGGDICIAFNGTHDDTRPSKLSEIPMLHGPAEDVNEELEKLAHSGEVSLSFRAGELEVGTLTTNNAASEGITIPTP
jgi:SulP family sulfate permease